MTPKAPDPQALLSRAGLRAKKSWGQNFLRDANILRQIAAATGAGPDTPVLELGAGLGALTHTLLLKGGAVFAVERDRELVPLLRETLSWADRLTIIEADAASLDYAELRRRIGVRALVVVGNLPYQIASRILVSLADAAVGSDVGRAVIMTQREVSGRLVANPGSRAYGLLTILVRRSCDVEVICVVAPGAFHPRPKVESAVVRLTAHGRALPSHKDAALVVAARAAFSQRRKTLRNSLAGGLGCPPNEAVAMIETAGLDPGCRAETLDLEAFARLGDALAAAGF